MLKYTTPISLCVLAYWKKSSFAKFIYLAMAKDKMCRMDAAHKMAPINFSPKKKKMSLVRPQNEMFLVL